MKKLYGIMVFLLFLAPALFAQEHYTEGPVWRISLIRVKPNRMDEYLTNMRQNLKPFYEEWKKEGMVVDYKIFFKETKENPQDWDLCLAIEYKNFAAMDGLTAKAEGVRDKILGGKQAAHDQAEKREEIREVISSTLLREVFLK